MLVAILFGVIVVLVTVCLLLVLYRNKAISERDEAYAECDDLNSLVEEIGAKDAAAVLKKIRELEKEQSGVELELLKLKEANEKIELSLEEKKKEMIVIDEDLLLESFALYRPQFHFQTSEEYKERLVHIRDKAKQMIRNKSAATGSQNWTVNNSKKEGNKMVNNMIKLLLRAFNNECDYCVDRVKFNNIESHKNRIEKSFEMINKLGTVMEVKISNDYKNLKIEELSLAYEYQQKKQEEKEEQKQIRAEIREQQKLEKEIKEAKEKIAKERKHFNQALTELNSKLEGAVNEDEKKLLAEKIAELQGQCDALDNEEKLVDYRLQNAKAGYVYVISNVGSFGDGVYKIGMTRRLEPMERVNELGDASVPFTFDVHSLIFSDNAPELEAKLHEHFYDNRVNKINNRKEFYRASINEIEKVIKANYSKVVDFVKEAPAEQYREGLMLQKQLGGN